MKIAVTGARGMLGSDICKVLGSRKEIFPFDVDDFDIVDWRSTQEKISEKRPDLVIHCAAYTDVDRAEHEQEKAFSVNAIGTRNVALVCQRLEIPILYISTDYVFDGKKGSPYFETDQPNPLNVYGRSKLAGEEYVKTFLKKFYIVRTAWLYGKNGENFVYKILRAATPQFDESNPGELKVVADQIGNPTYTFDLAEALDLLTESECYGVYHITNKGYCSWYQFAKKIFEILKRDVRLKPCDSSSFHSTGSSGQRARRPKFSALENFVWSKTFNKKLRHWEEALEDFISSTRL